MTRAAGLAKRRALLSIALDLVVLIGFAAIGRRSHGEGNALGDTLAVAWPFVAAWLAVARAVARARSDRRRCRRRSRGSPPGRSR